MKMNNEYYLIQMELEYLEFTTQARLLRHPLSSIEQWKKKTQELSLTIKEIKKRQSLLVDGAIDERKKVGVFVPLEERVHYVITDLLYRKDQTPLAFMQQLFKLSPKALQRLWQHLRKAPTFVNAAIQEPNEAGELFQTGYGTLPWTFPANSFFMEMRVVPGENLVMTAAPSTHQITCVAYKKLGASKVDCEEYLKDLP